MLDASRRLTAAPKLLLAACVSAAIFLSGCSDDKPEQPATKPAAQAETAAAQAGAANVEKAKQEAQAKAAAEAKAKALEPKVTVLPEPGVAPEPSQYLDIGFANHSVLAFEALRGGPLSLDVLKASLQAEGAYGKEISPLLETSTRPIASSVAMPMPSSMRTSSRWSRSTRVPGMSAWNCRTASKCSC